MERLKHGMCLFSFFATKVGIVLYIKIVCSICPNRAVASYENVQPGETPANYSLIKQAFGY